MIQPISATSVVTSITSQAGHHEREPICFEFASLRKDWYASNSAMPKAARRHIKGKQAIVFQGFPRHWIPVFEWFNLPWAKSIKPDEHIPFFSDLTEEAIVRIVERAKQEKTLRILVESATMYDPILSDFLYIMDNTLALDSAVMENDLLEITAQPATAPKRRLILNGWQGYGRPAVRALEAAVLTIQPKSELAVVLPCSLKRPYNKSNTHKRIYRILQEQHLDVDALHRIVITSLGVLPEEVWTMPQVLAYDAGVPDIYRILRLVRSFFSRARYECVIDCLQFKPYSDVLRIAQREGIIKHIRKIEIPGQKHFYLRP